MDERPDLGLFLEILGAESRGTIALPGVGEFSPEPESALIDVIFFSAPPIAVPRQLGAAEYEHWDHQVAFRRSDVPDLRHGAVLRAAAAPGEPVRRWFIDQVQEARGDEVRALVKAMAEET